MHTILATALAANTVLRTTVNNQYRISTGDTLIDNLHYADSRLVALYDTENMGDHDWMFYEERIGESPKRVADVGCGTGAFAVRLAAAGHTVVGVDPAPAMLDFARRRPGGERVTWVHGVADDLPHEPGYDYATMMGHAFQCLVTDEEVEGTLTAVRERLLPGGRFMFESRNPSLRAWLRWHKQRSTRAVGGDDGGQVETMFDVLSVHDQIVIFDTHYWFREDNAHLVDRGQLRFMPQSEIDGHLRSAGFTEVEWFGGWDGTPFDERTSGEIIAIAG